MLALLTLSAGAQTAAAKCGEEYRGAPARSTPGDLPLAIGDSVLADAVPQLVGDGFEADGMVCRQMSQGIALLQARSASLPHLVVLALGTNGEVTSGEIDAALRILGPRRVLALVTPHNGVIPSTPGVIRAAAEGNPERILLLDWDHLAASHPEWLAPDGVHLGGAAGAHAFAQMIASLLSSATSTSEDRSPTVGAGVSESHTVGAPVTIDPVNRSGHLAAHDGATQTGPQGKVASEGSSPAPTISSPLKVDGAVGRPTKVTVTPRGTSYVVLSIWGALAFGAVAGAVLWRAKRR